MPRSRFALALARARRGAPPLPASRPHMSSLSTVAPRCVCPSRPRRPNNHQMRALVHLPKPLWCPIVCWSSPCSYPIFIDRGELHFSTLFPKPSRALPLDGSCPAWRAAHAAASLVRAPVRLLPACRPRAPSPCSSAQPLPLRAAPALLPVCARPRPPCGSR
jgi:hypothetical protein